MFDKKMLESAEFYDRRYRNFATLIIIPVFLLFVLLVVFSIFGKRELTVKAAGQIVPRKVLSIVQSTSSNPIELNNLSEGKQVKKGNVLITYKDSNGNASKELLTTQLKTANDRLSALDTYKKSIDSGTNQFVQPDSFGYSDMFTNYLAQVNTLNAEYNQQVSDKTASDNQVNNQKSALNDAASQDSNKISQYQKVLNAIKTDNNSGISSGNPYAYIYDSYIAEAKGLTGDEKEKVKQNSIANVRQAIDQLNESVIDYQTQAKSIGKGADISQAPTQDKISSLKSDQLASATKEYADQNAVVDKINAQIKSAESEVADNTLHADQSGVLHILTDKVKPKYLSKGSEVAEIYPNLANKPALNIEFMVPADKISGIKEGQTIRFRVANSVSKPLILEGKVHRVETTATNTKQGNYFKIIAHVALSNLEYTQIKYGSEGTVTIITGEKTWFNYIKDQIFKNE